MRIVQYGDFKVSLEGYTMWVVENKKLYCLSKNIMLITEKISEWNFTGIGTSA
jgi:hypothetical protein